MTIASVATILAPRPSAAVDVLTWQYDNSRNGANTNEVVLTPLNVSVTNFGRLFTYQVDGYVYAAPLYVSGVTIPGQGTRNVVYVATENDTVYALDADGPGGASGGLLWRTNLGIAAQSTLFGKDNLLNPLIGITGTPVIDPVLRTIYVDAFAGPVAATTNCAHWLHALDLATGAERPFSPVLVQASVAGTGRDAVKGVVRFLSRNHLNRPALTLAGGVLYLSYCSYSDTDPYHGWVIGFDPTSLVQLTNYVFASSPNATTMVFGIHAGEGGIWMSGAGLCVDGDNQIYLTTGNGSFSANTNGGDYGDCFVKLSTTNGLTVLDYFAPWNQASMALGDKDLGSGGPILLPHAVGSAAHPHLMVAAGKEGTLYLVDRDNLGHYGLTNRIVQTISQVIGGLWGSPAYFNNLVYFQGVGDFLKAFRITNGVMTTTAVMQSTNRFGGVGYTPSISANGTNSGIAWVIDTSAYPTNGPAVLHAYNATNLVEELYNSSQNLARDNPGGAVKFAVPVVANGKVFVRGEYALSVYGLLPGPTLGGSLSASTVILSWPTNTSPAYRLQAATNGTGGTWFNVTNPVVTTNARFRVSLPLSGVPTFYRLKR
jgi:hypothetical protein